MDLNHFVHSSKFPIMGYMLQILEVPFETVSGNFSHNLNKKNRLKFVCICLKLVHDPEMQRHHLKFSFEG